MQSVQFGVLTLRQRRLFPKGAVKQATQMLTKPDLQRLERLNAVYAENRKEMRQLTYAHSATNTGPFYMRTGNYEPKLLESIKRLEITARQNLVLLVAEEQKALDAAKDVPGKLELLGGLKASSQRFRTEFVKALAKRMK